MVDSAYHGAVRVRPDLVPVGGDGRTGRGSRGELQSTRSAVIVASQGRVRRVRDGVAAKWEEHGA